MPEDDRGDSTDCSVAEYELIRREEVANLQGSFTWDFGQQFFIETEEGNFVWSSPDYDGSGLLWPTNQTYQQWIGRSFGRDKGIHKIGDYCKGFKLMAKM